MSQVYQAKIKYKLSNIEYISLTSNNDFTRCSVYTHAYEYSKRIENCNNVERGYCVVLISVMRSRIYATRTSHHRARELRSREKSAHVHIMLGKDNKMIG